MLMLWLNYYLHIIYYGVHCSSVLTALLYFFVRLPTSTLLIYLSSSGQLPMYLPVF